MVDFSKLITKKKDAPPINPQEIFRRLPKPEGINDLYGSQVEVLDLWHEKRENRDTVIKLHTGGGKTLVGLLIAQSVINETKKPVLYLVPTTQLVNQTIEKAKALGIVAVPYKKGEALNSDFKNGKAIMIATYKALFNGKSKFGVRGGKNAPEEVAAIILDDAHAAFSVVRDTFTIKIASEDNKEFYKNLTGIFRNAFKDIDRIGTFDDIVSGFSDSVIEIPYWVWNNRLTVVREYFRNKDEDHALTWPLLRDNLHLCHALISKKAFTITPVLPLVDMFPTFSDAPRRIYMSATISDDSEILRTFDADRDLIKEALTSRSLAGISERMILIPELMPFSLDFREAIRELLKWTTEERELGAVILVPSDAAAERWNNVATVAKGPQEVQRRVSELQNGISKGPFVFASRYDGIDLPGDSCRLLVMESLPAGTSDYELLRANALNGSSVFSRMLAQRIEQGIGRGARGSGDYCVVLLISEDLACWVAKDANFKLLTSATRAQLEMGIEVSEAVSNYQELKDTIIKSYDRESHWMQYHAATLADKMEAASINSKLFHQAAIERKAFNLWYDSHHEKAINQIEKLLAETDNQIDAQSRGWLQQFAARIASQWGHADRAEEFQQAAYASNRNLLRPMVSPPYRTLSTPRKQANAIASLINEYHMRRGFLKYFEKVVSYLTPQASANQFEQSLADFGKMLGISSERCDFDGDGPDVLWLLPDAPAWIIEAKSQKKADNLFTKKEHGQLLVAEEWFKNNYPKMGYLRVSVHAKNIATKSAQADKSYALTYEKLTELVSDSLSFFEKLCDSNLASDDFLAECERQLANSPIEASKLAKNYLLNFVGK